MILVEPVEGSRIESARSVGDVPRAEQVDLSSIDLSREPEQIPNPTEQFTDARSYTNDGGPEAVGNSHGQGAGPGAVRGSSPEDEGSAGAGSGAGGVVLSSEGADALKEWSLFSGLSLSVHEGTPAGGVVPRFPVGSAGVAGESLGPPGVPEPGAGQKGTESAATQV